MREPEVHLVERCWHCLSMAHSTLDCPGRYRGGAVDGTYEEFLKKQKDTENNGNTRTR